MASKGESIVRTFNTLVTERGPLELYWRDAFRYSYPIRGEAFINKSGDGIQRAPAARAKQAKLFDSTGTDSVRLLASSLISGLTPASSQWFQLTIPNVPDKLIPKDVKAWLQNASTAIFEAIHSSNYNAEAYEFFTDIGIGGMAGLFIDKHPEGGLYFEMWSLAALYCKETLSRGYIDTVYRKVPMSAQEAINKFGISALPVEIQQHYATNPSSSKVFDFIHTIRPRLKNGKQVAGKTNKQMPWEAIYVYKETGVVVSESGYNEFPVVIPRWMKIPDTDYALGPFNDALPDVKTLNQVMEMMLTNADMAIAGTFAVKDNGTINPATFKIGARKVVIVEDPNDIKPLTTAGDFRIAQEEIQRLQAQIKRVMMSDQLAPNDRANMTATEVQTRTQMVRMILAPVYGRLQSEFLDPLIRRCFGLMARANLLGTPPQSMQQTFGTFIPTYQSPIAKAQKMEMVTSLDNFNARLTQMAQVSPNVLDWYDSDAAIHIVADLLGTPVDVLRDEKDVQQSRDQKEQQQQMQQSAQAMQQMTPEQQQAITQKLQSMPPEQQQVAAQAMMKVLPNFAGAPQK
ncbi:MAG: portal protein [Burkholderiales bacterium]